MLTHLYTPCSPPRGQSVPPSPVREAPKDDAAHQDAGHVERLGQLLQAPGAAHQIPLPRGKDVGVGQGSGGPPLPLCCPPRLASAAGRVNPTPWPTATAAGRVDPTQRPMERNAKKVPRNTATLPRIPIAGRHLHGFIQPLFDPPFEKTNSLIPPFLAQH